MCSRLVAPPVLQTAGGFLSECSNAKETDESADLVRRRRLSQAEAESCQTPKKHLETDELAKDLSVSLHLHTLPSRNAESRTQTLDHARGSLLQESEEQ